ncbi:metallophosphoesterase family protein [Hymenobacter jeollabukensis]|uniref:Metallophosphoesterase n=1 Tax=Hymenobacter jeollabukensis TaxID=2025313 RepID=A0A5R8WTD6_9BACT|nr:metallophosphoesterase [Hymenobacter jeollabukensis]TLM95017.1 metallophosphoesterase [Hymenobacter jeollabukensis]
MPQLSTFYHTLLRGRAGLLTGAALLLGSLLSGCDLIEFSPNETRTPEAYSDLTRKNLERLRQQPNPSGGDTVRFVFVGDSQRFYEEAEAFTQSVNQQRNVAFVAISGDISDFGLIREMRWVHDRLKKLNVPYLTVIGNHDLVANGREAYQKVYGPLNYSFEYGHTRFVLVDTNGREYGFNGRVPDVPWVQQALASPGPGISRQVVMSHVPPHDLDFDPQLVSPYVQALSTAPRVAFELNGHKHDFSIGQPYENGLTFINSYSFEKRQYVVLTLWGEKEFKLDTVQY